MTCFFISLSDYFHSTPELVFFILIYIVAFAISYPFNSRLLAAWYVKKIPKGFMTDIPFFPAAFGTLCAYILSRYLMPVADGQITFLGNDTGKNLLIAAVPMIVYTAAGVKNEHATNKHLYGLEISALILVYAVMEEVFWRGFIQNYFFNANIYVVNSVIGILWWAWHCRFRTLFDLLAFPLICIGSSLLIGIFTHQTHAIITAAALHSLVVIMSVANDDHRKKNILLAIIVIVAWRLLDRYY